MSLLTRLRATEAEKSHDSAGALAADASENKENLDPRAKMMKEIQVMLDGYTTCLVDSDGTPANAEQDNLSLRLKHDFCNWGGMLYATSIDNVQSACQSLTQRVEAIAAEEQRMADKVACAYENFAYPLGASLVQQEKADVPTGETTTLDEAANAFQQHLKDTARELDALWGDWSRSPEECRKMPEEFDRFVQDQLESFRRTCDADLEKMETLEQEFKEQLQSQVSNYLKCLVADL